MMHHHDNPYSGFPGRGRNGFRGSDYAPYRRPFGRGIPSDFNHSISGQSGSGCGCNAGRRLPFDGGHGQTLGSANCPDQRSNTPCVTPPSAAVSAQCGNSIRTPQDCGCGKNTDHHLMDQIRAVDFALYETILYLDVYPHSCDALETYHKLKAQSEALHREFETVSGPITAFGNQNTASWDWMSKPFPWEYDAD